MNELMINNYVPSIDVFERSFNKTEETNNSMGGVSFADSLTSALNEVNNKQLASQEAGEMLVSGQDIDIADVMLASSEAKISLQLAVEVRNKLLSAYNEITRMSL